MLKANWLLEKIRNTTLPCIGTWITLPSPETVDVICSAGVDFVVIDSEHAPISYETAQLMVMACESRKVSPVFRVPAVLGDRIVPALEIGSHAIQVPNIESVSMVEAFISAARYQPLGNKGLSPFTRACNYSADFAQHMVTSANSNTMLIAQIEGRTGIENLKDILDIRNIDICFIGLYDLSNYMNIPGELDNSKLRDLFSSLSKQIIDKGMIVGSIANSAEQVKFLISAGVRYITYSADCHMLSKAYKEVMTKIQSYC